MIPLRLAREYMYQLDRAGLLERLKNALSTIPVLVVLHEGGEEYGLLGYWKKLTDAGYDAAECYSRSLAGRRQQASLEWAAELDVVADLLEDMSCWSQAEEVYRELLEYSETQPLRTWQMKAHRGLGLMLRLRGEYAGAMAHYQESLAIGEELDDPHGISAAIGYMGNVHNVQGRYVEAMECFERQLAICEKLGDRRGMSIAIGNMGNVHGNQGRYEKAMECFGRLLLISQELGDRRGISVAFGNLGIVHYRQGRYKEAMECLGRQLAICEEIGERSGMSHAFGYMGTIHSLQARYAEAMRCCERKLAICQELGDRSGVSYAIGDIGLVHVAEGRFAEAMECFGRQHSMSEELGDRRGAFDALGSMGTVHYEQGRYAEALRCFHEALDMHRSMGILPDVAEWLAGTSSVLVELAEHARARHPDEYALPEYLVAYVPGIALVSQSGQTVDKPGQATDLSGQADWKYVLQSAREHSDECIRLAEQLHMPDLHFRARLLLARIDDAEGHPDEAVQRLTGMLNEASEEQRAELHYWFWRIGGRGSGAGTAHVVDHRLEAWRLYEVLFATKPKHEFRKRIEELQASTAIQ